MKKVLSVMLVLCLLLALSASLTSCAHKCEFSTDWSKDEASHWHECIGEDCTEVADKAEHTWNEGEITTEATQEEDGVKTFTCTACAQTKTESVAFTGLSEADWNAALADAVFENFTYKEVATSTGSGVSIVTEATYKFTEDNAWFEMTLMGQTAESYAPDKASANELRAQMVDSIKSLTPYASYEYDAATKTYQATKEVDITGLGASTKDVTLTFVDGKLAEIKYSISLTQEGIVFDTTSTVTISDYGTVVLTPAAQ